jgi:Spy/CpxP family protein refolding chaperone
MKWLNLMSIAGLLFILPVGSYAAQFTPTVNNVPQNLMVLNDIAQLPSKTRGAEGNQGINRHRLQWLQQLDLTPEQSEQIRAIHQQSQEDRDTLYQQLKAAKEDMRSLLSSDATAEELREQHQQLQNLQQQASDRRFETMLQIREVLTPEQRNQMAELMQKHRGSNETVQNWTTLAKRAFLLSINLVLLSISSSFCLPRTKN